MALIACIVLRPLMGNAAALTGLSNDVSRHQISTLSNHNIVFTTPTGVDAATDTVTFDFTGFGLGSVGVGDIDFSHGTTGVETAETLASSPAAGVWGVSFSGTTVTLTAPTDAASGEIVAGDRIRILIGTNAVGGMNQITNPGTEGEYPLTIAGTFGDTGSIGLAVAESDNVTVSGTVQATSTGGGPAIPPGGGPADATPPIIFNVQASSTSPTTASVSWQTDEEATSEVAYGHDFSYASGTVSDVTRVLVHRIDLTGLIPCSLYRFRIRSSDWSSNRAEANGVFSTPCDTRPPEITDPRALNVTDSGALIVWNTHEPATSFVEYGTTSGYGQTASIPGFVVVHGIPIAGLLPATLYHFRVLSADPSGNLAVSADYTFTTLGDSTAPANVALVATPGNARVFLSWTVPTDSDFAGTRIVRKTGGYPTGPLDGDLIFEGSGTSFTDTAVINGVTYYYGAYAFDTSGNFSSGSLAQATPSAVPIPPVSPTIPPGLPPGAIPPGLGATSTPATPGATIGLQLFGARGTLPLVRGSDGAVGTLSGAILAARVPVESLNGTPSIISFSIDGTAYALSYSPRENAYIAWFAAPLDVGVYGAEAQAVFTDGRVARIMLVLRVQPSGRVFERSLIGGEVPIEGARVYLFRFEGSEQVPWDGSAFAQENPMFSDENGTYAFEVPPGRYAVEVQKEGYWAFFGAPVFIDGNVFAAPVELIRAPLPPHAVISPTSTPVENVVAVAQNIGDHIVALFKLLRQFLSSSAWRDLVQNVLTPLLLLLVLLNAASAISLFNLFAFLQYLLSLPFLLRRSTKPPMGVVYNAYAKHPVDLTVVRLVHAPSGLTVQTRVTSRDGKYSFTAKPGTYRLEAVKPGYAFPSQYVRGKKGDGDFANPYLGDRLTVDNAILVTPDIPLDPIVPAESARQAVLRDSFQRLQHAVAVAGAMAGGAAFLLAPSLAMAGLALVHAGVYFTFRRLQVPPKVKENGKIFDVASGKPIHHAVVRLLEAKTKKLIEIKVTDKAGKYGFVAGKNVYDVSTEAFKYRPTTIPGVDLTASEVKNVSVDVGLEKDK